MDEKDELSLEKEKQQIINSIDKEQLDKTKVIINNYSKLYVKNNIYYTTETNNGGTNGN